MMIYLKILTDNELEDFIVTNFGEYFKCTREKLCSKVNEKQNLRKVVLPIHIFFVTPDEVQK